MNMLLNNDEGELWNTTQHRHKPDISGPEQGSTRLNVDEFVIYMGKCYVDRIREVDYDDNTLFITSMSTKDKVPLVSFTWPGKHDVMWIALNNLMSVIK